MVAMMSFELSAAGSMLLKLVGVPAAAGLAACMLAFLFRWPKSLKEALARLACTLLATSLAGPVLVIAAYCWWPALFASAGRVAGMVGGPAELGLLVVAAPFLVLAGLPAWWVLGALVLWFDRRRGKDIAEVAQDAVDAVRSFKKIL